MWQRRSNDRILWEDPKNIENIICISINQHIATNYMVDFATNPICIIHHKAKKIDLMGSVRRTHIVFRAAL